MKPLDEEDACACGPGSLAHNADRRGPYCSEHRISGGQSARRSLRCAGMTSARAHARVARFFAVPKKHTNASNKDPSAEEREIWIITAAVILVLTWAGWALFLFWPARID